MTAPKRWYQLSMLQLLVAMAVVAALVVQNVTADTTLVPIRHSLGTQTIFGSRSFGWPFIYAKTDGIFQEDRFVPLFTVETERPWRCPRTLRVE